MSESSSRVMALVAAGLILTGVLGPSTVRVAAQPTQPIYLQYDGFVRNKDGTLTLSFGYFNMNNVEVTVPSGDGNFFTPGAGDRSQPVTFLKGRHRFACSMVVDKTFDGKLQWTVKFAGRTETTTPKALDPLYELLAINGHIEDDGLPRGSRITSSWKKISGPGDVTFSDTSTGPTRVKFSAPGAYVIELSATDGEKSNALKLNATVANP